MDYPPSRTVEFGTALEDINAKLEAATGDGNDDADAADGGSEASPTDVTSWKTYRSGLEWAVDQWGDDATVTLQAFTANSRARTLDAARTHTVGEFGRDQMRTALVAGAVTAAPWLDGDESLAERVRVTGSIPPSLLDWLDNEVTDLNELGN